MSGADLKLSPARFDPSLGLRVVPELSQKQKELLAIVLLAAALGDRRKLIVGCVGEWGGGKSMIALILFLVLCVINSDPDCTDPDLLPCSGIWAETEDDVTRATVAELLQIVPTELIRKRTDDYILWEFGHRTWLYGARKSAQGGSLTHCLADEIQARPYTKAFDNIKARARADRAVVNVVIVCGLAEHGHVETILRYPKPDAGERVVYRILLPEENPANPPGYADSVKSGTAGSRERGADGWLVKHGARYPKYSFERNSLPVQRTPEWFDRSKLTNLPIAIGIDLRTRASAVIAVPVPHKIVEGSLGVKEVTAWLAVDQVIVDNCGDGELAIRTAERIREMGWHVEPGVSEGCVDPTAIEHELDAWRTAIPGLKMAQIKSGRYQREDAGIKCVDWNICDGHGNARWFVHPALEGDHYRGVPESLRGWMVASPKDQMFEDSCDAVRYLLTKKSPHPERPLPKKIDLHAAAIQQRAFGEEIHG